MHISQKPCVDSPCCMLATRKLMLYRVPGELYCCTVFVVDGIAKLGQHCVNFDMPIQPCVPMNVGSWWRRQALIMR